MLINNPPDASKADQARIEAELFSVYYVPNFRLLRRAPYPVRDKDCDAAEQPGAGLFERAVAAIPQPDGRARSNGNPLI
ncbi:hypothetical protein ACG7TL_004356 [Trametes sanguinea]